MGQSINKFKNEKAQKKDVEIDQIVKEFDKKFEVMSKELHVIDENKSLGEEEKRKKKFAIFYCFVCETVGEMNNELGGTQLLPPRVKTLEETFKTYHKGEGEMTKDEFKTIIREIIFNTRPTGSGGKDIILHIFGVPMTALFIKNIIMPNAIPNEFFIPAVTSFTVFALAKLNKI